MRIVLWVYAVVVTFALIACGVFDGRKLLNMAFASKEPPARAQQVKVSGRLVTAKELAVLLPTGDQGLREPEDVFLLARVGPRHLDGRPILTVQVIFSAPPLLGRKGATLAGFGGYSLHPVELPRGLSNSDREKLLSTPPHFEVQGVTVK